MVSRIKIAQKDICTLFGELPEKVLTRHRLQEILSKNREFWRLSTSTNTNEFIKFLIDNCSLKDYRFDFPHRPEILYSWGDVPKEYLFMSLGKKCYFSHYTAIRLHDLTEQDPKNIYINDEQYQSPSQSELKQDRIDYAFSQKPRMTSNYIKFQEWKIYLINGINTGYIGIDEYQIDEDNYSYEIRVSDIERTLIDAAVRPFYSGGIGEVLKAYRNASGNVSVNRLGALLKKIKYVYPYHQAIGFYLEKSEAYSKKEVDFFRNKFSYEFDFYLSYDMKEKKYNEKWQLFVPLGI